MSRFANCFFKYYSPRTPDWFWVKGNDVKKQPSPTGLLRKGGGIFAQVRRVSLASLFIGFSFVIPAQPSDRSADFEAFSWMEQQLLSEKESLIARIGNEDLIFFQNDDGSIVTFNRAAVMNILDKLAFLTTSEPFSADVVRYLPPEVRDIIADLQSVGLWSPDLVAGRAIAAIERRSQEARAEARRRVEFEYNPLIEEVQEYARGVLQAHANTGQSTPIEADLIGDGSYEFTVICPERKYTGTLEIFRIAGQGSKVQVNLNGSRAGNGTLSGRQLTFEEEAYGHIWKGTVTATRIYGEPMNRESSNNLTCPSWSATGNN